MNLILKPYKITNDIKLILTWTSDDDIEEAYDNIKDTYNLKKFRDIIKIVRLNYNIINEILLLNNTEQKYIKNLIKYIKKHDKELVLYTFKLFNNLINYISLKYCKIFITFDKYLKKSNQLDLNIEELVLYRGFNYRRYKPVIEKIKLLDIFDKYITECFLSTSIYINNAKKFMSKNEELENTIIWKININRNNFDKFYYSYLSKITHNITNLESESEQETEFLLNINIELTLINKYINNNITYYEWNYNEIKN